MLSEINLSKGEKVKLFSLICVEIASKCNRHCYFCPNSYFNRPDQFMDFDLIKKIIQDLKEVDYRGNIAWFNYNEPTRDKRLPEIIKYCREQLPHVCQQINTNCDYFKTKEDIKLLFDAGLNQMQLNIYSASDKSLDKVIFDKGVGIAQKRFDLMNKWVKELAQEGVIKEGLSLYQHIGAKNKTAKVIKKFGVQRTDKNKDVDGPNNWSNRSGLIEDFKEGLKEPLKKYCTRPFRIMIVDWNGECLLCCNDYLAKTSVGNVGKENVIDLWNSWIFNVYRIKLQNSRRDCYLCDKCDFNGGFYPHMIHPVTTGDKKTDDEIINTDFTEYSSIFKNK